MTWRDSGTLWSRVIELEPVGRAYYYRGDFFMSKGDFDAAAADFKESIRMGYEAGHPEVYTMHAFRGEALRKGGHYEEALKEFNAAINLAPLPNFHYYRSLVLRALGRIVEADADLLRSGGDDSPIIWQYIRDRDDLKPRN
jgi:protein O-mannosyl-transferase